MLVLSIIKVREISITSLALQVEVKECAPKTYFLSCVEYCRGKTAPVFSPRGSGVHQRDLRQQGPARCWVVHDLVEVGGGEGEVWGCLRYKRGSSKSLF